MNLGLYEMRIVIIVGYHGLLLALSLSFIFLSPWAEVGLLLGLTDLFTFRRLPLDRLLSQILLRQTRCPRCQRTIRLVNSWRCGSCGYRSEPRHVFSRCEHCLVGASFLSCPSCQQSILVAPSAPRERQARRQSRNP